MNPHAVLVLEDGSQFEGFSFGYAASVSGEVVFNTAMTGYPESLTDPSYAGQIMVLTYPLVGNYGVPPCEINANGLARYMESERIFVKGMVVFDYSDRFSHWNGCESLSDWLKREHIPAIYGIDTRALTKLLREKGSMKGKIIVNDLDTPWVDPNVINQVAEVSCREVIKYNDLPGQKRVVLVDCGVKHNIIRSLVARGVTVVRVPWDYDFASLEYDGLFLSNGPGNPDLCEATVAHIRHALTEDRPICGICMGNQLLGKAAGATIYKLKYGHRSHNQPVKECFTGRCYITSQNHGFAVDEKTLPSDWEPLFVNMNDGTNEGIRHKTKPFFSAQFHPEACGGPTDTSYIFDQFIAML